MSSSERLSFNECGPVAGCGLPDHSCPTESSSFRVNHPVQVASIDESNLLHDVAPDSTLLVAEIPAIVDNPASSNNAAASNSPDGVALKPSDGTAFTSSDDIASHTPDDTTDSIAMRSMAGDTFKPLDCAPCERPSHFQ